MLVGIPVADAGGGDGGAGGDGGDCVRETRQQNRPCPKNNLIIDIIVTLSLR